jgi:Cu-Zn family superoxide dismutase
MKALQTLKYLAIFIGTGLYLSGCDSLDEKGQGVPIKPEVKNQQDSETTTVTQKVKGKIAEFENNVIEAKSKVFPTKGNEARGEVFFTVIPEGVRIVADFEGLTPGEHGFHIHDKGDCSAADASSAGGHFNPSNSKHGGPESLEKHAGDLGNLTADEQGRAHFEWTTTQITLNGENSIIGRSVVIHADVDDFATQPAGNSGSRVGCGVIEAIK